MSREKGFQKKVKIFFKGLGGPGYIRLALSLLGVNAINATEAFFPDLDIPVIYSFSIIIIISLFIIILYSENDPENLHSFEAGSEKEANFFYTWYKKPGTLYLYCSELEWLEGDYYGKIVTALKRKSNKLKIYLKNKDHDIARDLESCGVKITEVPNYFRSEHTFSILEHSGLRSIIIRNKWSKDSKIEIEEYKHNPTLVDLSLDMLDASEYNQNDGINNV